MGTKAQFRCRVGESGFNPRPLNSDLTESLLDLGARHGVVGQGSHQAVFLSIKFLQLPGECGMAFLGAGGLVGQGFVQEATDLAYKVVRESKRAVVVDDRLFHQLHAQVGQIAQPIVTAAADEVLVLDAAPPGAFREDDAAGTASRMTPITEEEALQIVVMHPITLASATACSADFLDALEKVWCDQGLMSTGVNIAFVDNEAHVVGIAQHDVQRATRDWLLWVPFRCPGSQAQISHSCFQALN